VFSAVSLDCTRKFKDVLRSGKVVAELSDSLCREQRLAIVENPQDKTVSYDKWQGSSARITSRDTIRMMSPIIVHHNFPSAILKNHDL
jgi:hypothetical protein